MAAPRSVLPGFPMALLLPVTASAETGYDAWLRYEALDEKAELDYIEIRETAQSDDR